MVAQWRQQKELKIKRQRMKRAWAKSFSMSQNRRGDAPVPSPVFLNDQGEPTDVIGLGTRSKAARNTVPAFIDAMFRDHNPLNTELPKMIERSPLASKDLMLDRIEDILLKLKNNNPRVLVLKQLVQSTRNGGTIQARAEHWVVQRIKDTDAEKLFLYICQNKAMFVWAVFDGTQEVRRRSIIYMGRGNAMSAYVDGIIIWDETRIIGMIEPNPPSTS